MNAISDFDVTWSYGSSALRKISAEYERLRLRTNGAILFSDWPWLQAAANHLVPSSGREIATLEIRRCRELVACIPFTRGREFIHGLPAQTLRLLGYPLADRVAIVMDPAEPGLSDSIVAAIVDSRAAIADVAILGELPRLNGQSDDLAHAATMRDQRFFRRHCSRAPVLDIVGREALKASYSRALRTRLARARRKINHFKSIRFERIRPRPDEVPKLLSMIAAVEHESWKGQARKGIFSTAVRREFFTEISTARAAAGQLEISLLWLDHELVTYFYGFREHETYYDYNSAYLPKLKSYAVGRILLDEMLLSAQESGLKRIDGSRGSLNRGHLLEDWNASFIDHDELWLFAERWWGKLFALAICEAKPAAKRILALVNRT